MSLPDRLEKDSTHSDRIYQAVNDINFDYIFIESFGNNPLSDLSQEEGLKKQNEILDQSIAILTKKHPNSKIIFIATIAPNKENYAKGVNNLSIDERKKWAKERSAYIKNHLKYARDHNIPIIDIYDASLTWNGDGDLRYIVYEAEFHRHRQSSQSQGTILRTFVGYRYARHNSSWNRPQCVRGLDESHHPS